VLVDIIMKSGSFASVREMTCCSKTALRQRRFRYWCKSNYL